MSATVRAIAGAVIVAVGVFVPGAQFLIPAGASLLAGSAAEIIAGGPAKQKRQAEIATLSLGEGPREAVFGEAVTGGTLLDAYNYGGEYGTDWEVQVIALADHLCEALVGVYIGDQYKPFIGDGSVAGYNNQLKIAWHQGTADQAANALLLSTGGWSAADRLAGVCYVVVAYKADAPDAKHPVWPGGRPQFQWRLKGKRCYDPRKDTTVAGGAGSHRWTSPSTWEWTSNLAVCRYNWVRGVFACDRIDQPGQLLVGRGLSAAEAPPERVAPHANLCDELVPVATGGTEPRYRCAAVIGADEQFSEVEAKFAAACGGIITQPEGSVEVEPGHARPIVASLTDDDLLIGEQITFSLYRSEADDEWCNTVVASYVEPSQQWKTHAAPVRRVQADLLVDQGPRERKLTLDYVTSGTQAQRCAEIARRMGRLTATGTLPVGPRFCELEEGDWITYTSARRTRGQPLTFRIDSYVGDAKWQPVLTLRQVAANAYAWSPADQLVDGAVAQQQARPDDAYLTTYAGSGSLAALDDRVARLEEAQQQ